MPEIGPAHGQAATSGLPAIPPPYIAKYRTIAAVSRMIRVLRTGRRRLGNQNRTAVSNSSGGPSR
jgi:hypothetical protein